MGGKIESNLSWIPPDSDQRLCNISLWMTYHVHIILGLKNESNLVHTPPSPHYIRVHILFEQNKGAVKLSKITAKAEFD